eukprot:TRINITY_DN80215_c0_g1_i1.p1 TRINITY_DN80215_c0_g1~~TRINITY_DN80215_c0_g1_i1.p1  ORF type:complete len:355 (-),score=85.39 TRINITY_DN80215_c0_g1_i1:116-1180(-)
MTVAEMSWFEQGQQLLQAGDAAAAVKHLEQAATDLPDGLDLDGHLLLAEALWQQAGQGGTTAALPHYEAAARLAREAEDSSKEAAVSIGHGFALLQLNDLAAARCKLLRAKEVSETDGNTAAVQFVGQLLKQTEAGMSPQESAKATWLSFAEAYTNKNRPVLFMRGKVKEPLDEPSALGVAKLKAAGVHSMKVVDVCDPDSGLQAADIGIDFPQLYVAGAPVHSWMDMPVDELNKFLWKSGVVMTEPSKKEECHGAFSEGLEAWEVALVELVSKEGATDREAKFAELAKRDLQALPLTAAALEQEWQRLAPIVKEKLETQPEMPCGHSCNTCPTKHDCQLHDAVGHVRDIEDLL